MYTLSFDLNNEVAACDQWKYTVIYYYWNASIKNDFLSTENTRGCKFIIYMQTVRKVRLPMMNLAVEALGILNEMLLEGFSYTTYICG